MKMLRYSGLAVLVVCIAAFASGCGGGGGGGTAADDDMDVVMCTAPQVEMNGQCVDPPPTDADLIADAQDDLDGILADARTREQAARSAAASVRVHDDATATQIANANANATAAQDALAVIVTASGVANAATTPAQAEGAVDDARAARGDLITAQSAVASILSAVEAVATARAQREADEVAQTGGTSLIKHLRDNKLLADAVRGSLTAGSIVVGAARNSGPSSGNPRTPCAQPCAEFPADIGSGADRVTGQKTVRLQGLTSDSTTPSISGTGRLSSGFDLNNGTTTFVNAYTDISKESRARNAVMEDMPDTLHDERYDYEPDTDYLIAGIWLTVVPDNLSNSTITAFAYGGQPTSSATSNFCSGNENSGESGTGTTSVTIRECGDTTGFNTISTFVKDGQDFTATYSGNANGAYLAGSDTSYFTADVTLTAEFQNPTGAGTDGRGSIVGAVTNIVAGGQRMDGSIELQEQSLGNDIGGDDKFVNGSTIGVVDGKSFGGDWKGQFFGMTRYTRSQTTERTTDSSTPPVTTSTITTTYSPQAPGSVAGTFYATQQSAPVGDAAFIGSFAAHR